MTLEAQRVRELLRYDSGTGQFYWRVSRGKKIKAGMRAGYVATDKDGRKYEQIRLDYKLYKAHRLAWFYVHGEWPSHHVDHSDGNGLNNAISNLRVATNAENSRNSRPHADNKSGFKGVSLDKKKGKWLAKITVNYKQIFIGYYETPELAHSAYVVASKKWHGEFGRSS